MNRTLLASALALSTMTTVALAESVNPATDQPGAAKLTDTQMDRVTAGVNEAQLKSKTSPPTFRWGEFKSGSCTNYGGCKK
jgi:hypothetical protein